MCSMQLLYSLPENHGLKGHLKVNGGAGSRIWKGSLSVDLENKVPILLVPSGKVYTATDSCNATRCYV